MAIDAAGLSTSMKNRKRMRLLCVKDGQVVGRLWLDMARGTECIVRLETSPDGVSTPRQEQADDP